MRMILLVVKARYRTFEPRDRQTSAQLGLRISSVCHGEHISLSHPLMYVPSLRRSAILRRS
jgi:hypothetical protein